jgi:tripartite-type tricarboxylate transporter receptor subunit TctC
MFMNRPVAAAVTFALCFACGTVAAQVYPTQPVRVIIGFPPASTPDVVTRIVADRMAENLGRPVMVDNRPGAGGAIAAEAVARAPADGHTLMVDGCSASGTVYAFVLMERPPFDPFKDFTPVGRLMRDHWIVAVSPALGVGSLSELIAIGKSKPNALTFPSSGIGSSPHLQGERFRIRAGFEATHVPYKDNPIPDLVAGRTSFTVQSSAALVALIKSGKLKGLAVLSSERILALPDLPTTGEAGMPDLVYNAGICLYAVGGTPRAVVQRLNAALNQAVQTDVVKSRFAELGVEPAQGTPEDAEKYIRELMAQVDDLRLRVFGKAR